MNILKLRSNKFPIRYGVPHGFHIGYINPKEEEKSTWTKVVDKRASIGYSYGSTVNMYIPLSSLTPSRVLMNVPNINFSWTYSTGNELIIHLPYFKLRYYYYGDSPGFYPGHEYSLITTTKADNKENKVTFHNSGRNMLNNFTLDWDASSRKVIVHTSDNPINEDNPGEKWESDPLDLSTLKLTYPEPYGTDEVPAPPMIFITHNAITNSSMANLDMENLSWSESETTTNHLDIDSWNAIVDSNTPKP